MRNLNRTLRESDDALLPVLAQVWKVELNDTDDTGEMIDSLSESMLEKERAEGVWETLDENQRGALFMLIGFGAKMLTPRFEQLFGEIRRMGEAQIEREQPHKTPKSTAEALYYKGLVAMGYENTDTGARPVVYVPTDLLEVLPTHKTGYENLEAERDAEAVEIEPLHEDDVTDVQQADTSLVDDMTTLLAYVQLQRPPLETDSAEESALKEYRLADEDSDAVLAHLLTPDAERLTFLLGLALSAGLINAEDGRAQPKRAEARRWLEQSRAAQVRALAETWSESRVYRDLWHVEGLYPEPGGDLESYDPTIPRTAITGFLRDLVPTSEWWSVEELITAVKAINPDFQRSDYDSWYIRNEFDDYLEGFESWDAIEGALVEYVLTCPLHWLGLIDAGDDAARLTAYGRAFLGINQWPQPTEAQDKVRVEGDGTLLVSRKVSRIDRFQVARFTSWVKAGDPYEYKLDARGVAQADAQGITTEHIGGFISRALDGGALPPAIKQVLENWKSGDVAGATLERLLVLRPNSVEMLDRIYNDPNQRRFLRARLGSTAVVVQADQWEALRDALGEQGIQVDVIQ
jgi:hypothetical protein